MKSKIVKVIELREKGWTMKRIGDHFGWSKQYVYQLLKDVSITRHCISCGIPVDEDSGFYCTPTCRNKYYLGTDVRYKHEASGVRLFIPRSVNKRDIKVVQAWLDEVLGYERGEYRKELDDNNDAAT